MPNQSISFYLHTSYPIYPPTSSHRILQYHLAFSQVSSLNVYCLCNSHFSVFCWYYMNNFTPLYFILFSTNFYVCNLHLFLYFNGYFAKYNMVALEAQSMFYICNNWYDIYHLLPFCCLIEMIDIPYIMYSIVYVFHHSFLKNNL